MRSERAKKRPIVSDALYKSKIVSRMVNVIMLDGKKATARNIIYYVLENLAEDRKEATRMFEQAVKNVMPEVEVRSRRVGGATYQVPMPVKHDRAEALAIRWLVDSARNKKGKSMQELLHQEVFDAYSGAGEAMRKKETVHKMADANKAFSHFARY